MVEDNVAARQFRLPSHWMSQSGDLPADEMLRAATEGTIRSSREIADTCALGATLQAGPTPITQRAASNCRLSAKTSELMAEVALDRLS